MTWTLNESGTLTISGTGDMYDFVIANDMSWYNQRYDIKQIVIESGVTSIGRHAFYYCENVTSVLVQGEITRVGAFAFYECNKLVEIDLPDSNMEIGKMAFIIATH